ncbi:hypothetical protein [Austwickia chelonae]|uniref:hypothetical protein n=1 Tax=Austwickia chelonae TaxID=100225 RepID=UPI000E26F614|nr:hypothetical protein [Austwickia chelonae]
MARRGSIASWSLAGTLLFVAAAPAIAQVRVTDERPAALSASALAAHEEHPAGTLPGSSPHADENPTAGSATPASKACSTPRRTSTERRAGRARRASCPQCTEGPAGWRMVKILLHRQGDVTSWRGRDRYARAERRATENCRSNSGAARPDVRQPVRSAEHGAERSMQRQIGELVQWLFLGGLGNR